MGLAIDTSGSRASKVLFLAFRMRYEVAGTKKRKSRGSPRFMWEGRRGWTLLSDQKVMNPSSPSCRVNSVGAIGSAGVIQGDCQSPVERSEQRQQEGREGLHPRVWSARGQYIAGLPLVLAIYRQSRRPPIAAIVLPITAKPTNQSRAAQMAGVGRGATATLRNV